jgi:hypothetical protein
VVTRPPTLSVAAAVLALQGVAALLLGGFVAVETLVGDPDDVASSLFEAAFGLGVGAGLLWVARGALRCERWSRSPGVVAQIFALPVIYTTLQSGQYLVAVPLAVTAAVALVALLAPPTAKALYGEDLGR